MENKSGLLELLDRYPPIEPMRWKCLRRVRVGDVLLGRRDCMLVELERLPASGVDFGRICILASRLSGQSLFSTNLPENMQVYVCSIGMSNVEKSVFDDSDVRVTDWAIVSFK